MPEPVPTRREGNVAATRREAVLPGQAATRHEGGPASQGAWSGIDPITLPAALRARLSDLTPLPVGGGEAQLLRVNDADHPAGERALKVYFPHIEPDPDVWSRLSTLRSAHVIAVLETGKLTDGRFFELMEYFPKGSLRDVGAGRHEFDSASTTEMVRQLADGLAALHALGVVHRDLKPENVLVRAGSAIELVITDFGLSRRLEASARFTTAARTSAYAAPEAWAGHVSEARDWWSLGIMVLELATGQQAFAGLDERMIQMAVCTKPVPVDGIADPRLAMLCAGLLVSDSTKRWNGSQVQEWLAGRSPKIPDRRVSIAAEEIEFERGRYADPETLAEAMSRNWAAAARRYGIAPSPHWARLIKWLHQFDDPGRYDEGVVEARLDLLGELEISTEVPDVKLLRLIAGLNPKLPPIYRGTHVDAAALRALARQAQDGKPAEKRQAAEILDQLWTGKLLGVLARFDGGGARELAAIGTRWAAGGQQLNAAVAELGRNPNLPKGWLGKQHRAAALAGLLEAAAGAPRGDDWVRALQRRTKAFPDRVAWFDGVLKWAGRDPYRCFAALHAAGIAEAQAQKAVMARQAAEQARLARQRAWDTHEQGRLAHQGTAVGKAVGGAAVLAGLWLLVALFTGGSPLVLASVAIVIAVHGVIEIVLATTLAGDYHPRYSLLQWVQQAAGNIGRRMRWAKGRWALGIILAIVLMGFVQPLVPVAALGAAIAHGVWAANRHRRWSQEHDQYRMQVLQQ